MVEYADGKQGYINTIQAAVCTDGDLSDVADIHTLEQKLRKELTYCTQPQELLKSLLSDIESITSELQTNLNVKDIPDILDILYDDSTMYITVDMSKCQKTKNKLNQIKRLIYSEIQNAYLHRLHRIQ